MTCRLLAASRPAAIARPPWPGSTSCTCPPGGRIGRQRTGAPRLLAVLSGAGWASGADGGRRDVRAGYAALWAADEEHEAGSQAGLTAISVEGRFELLAVSVTRDIQVRDYDPAWRDWFEQVRARVWPAVQDVAPRIDQVGSTAVPGLAAKPIIDMDIVVASPDDVRPVIDRLARAGHNWMGDLGVRGREAFKARLVAELLARARAERGLPPVEYWMPDSP